MFGSFWFSSIPESQKFMTEKNSNDEEIAVIDDRYFAELPKSDFRDL